MSLTSVLVDTGLAEVFPVRTEALLLTEPSQTQTSKGDQWDLGKWVLLLQYLSATSL